MLKEAKAHYGNLENYLKRIKINGPSHTFTIILAQISKRVVSNVIDRTLSLERGKMVLSNFTGGGVGFGERNSILSNNFLQFLHRFC